MNMKASIKAMMMERGVSSGDCDIVMDLAEQVVNKCMETVDTMTNAAPEHLYPHTVALATLLLEGHLHQVNAAVRETLTVMAVEIARRG